MAMAIVSGQGARAQSSVTTEIAAATSGAIGRINHAGFRSKSHCTGFVVTGGHIVTAAHCLPAWEEESVHFQRGYDRGDHLGHYKSPQATFRTVANRDIALLCNAADKDVPALQITTRRITPGDPVGVAGYPIPRAHVLQMHNCQVWKQAKGGRIHIGCPVRPGASGAPIMVESADGPMVLGVMSASNRSSSRAYRLTPAMIAACQGP